MNYTIKSNSASGHFGSTTIKSSNIEFGTTPKTEDTLANPAELFLGALSACILKNVERFSSLLNFEYSKAEVVVNAVRLEKPPRMDNVTYELTIYSTDNKLNVELLKKNIEKFGTIFNTVKSSCSLTGEIKIVS